MLFKHLILRDISDLGLYVSFYFLSALPKWRAVVMYIAVSFILVFCTQAQHLAQHLKACKKGNKMSYYAAMIQWCRFCRLLSELF